MILSVGLDGITKMNFFKTFPLKALVNIVFDR